MSMKIMNNQEKRKKLIEKQHGTVLSTELDQYGIPRTYLHIIVEE